MSALGTILQGLGAIASIAYPPAAPFIAFAERIEPYAEAALPLIQAAVKEGPAAFSAAKEQAPQFFSELGNLAANLKGIAGAGNKDVSEHELATLAAHIVGVDPPGWTHEETQRWWDRATGTA